MSVPPQINYKPVQPSATAKYKFLRLAPNNLTGATTTIQATTSSLCEFRLPAVVYNLAESYFTYQVTLDAQGAGRVSWIHNDCLEVASNAYFGTAAGQDVCNINYVNRFTKIRRKMATKLQDYLSNDNTSQLYPSNALATSNWYPVLTPASGASSINTYMNYTEPKYITPSAADTAATHSRIFPLKGIPDSIFSVNKDTYWGGQEMFLRFTLGVGNQIAFNSGSITDPTNGTPVAIVGDIVIKNITLHLAVEQNQTIVDSVINKVMTSGLTMNIPYTVGFRNATGVGTANVQIQLNQQYGKKLKRMLHTIWNTTESANTNMDCSNYNGTKMSSYQTFLDSMPLQNYLVSTLAPSTLLINADDWRENEKYCRDTVIQNRNVYGLNWFSVDQFYEPHEGINQDDSQLDEGLPMDSIKLWSISQTAGVALTNYDFATFVRTLHITREGIVFV